MIQKIIVSVILMLAWSAAYAGKVNGLGNDYEVYDFGTYNPNAPWVDGSGPTANNWYLPAHQFKNPVYLY